MSLLQMLFVVYLILAVALFWLAFRLGREQRALDEEIEAIKGDLTARGED